jgi:hypothetical protein
MRRAGHSDLRVTQMCLDRPSWSSRGGRVGGAPSLRPCASGKSSGNAWGRNRPQSQQGRQDSNLQPPVLETGALPIAPRPWAAWVSVPPTSCDTVPDDAAIRPGRPLLGDRRIARARRCVGRPLRRPRMGRGARSRRDRAVDGGFGAQNLAKLTGPSWPFGRMRQRTGGVFWSGGGGTPSLDGPFVADDHGLRGGYAGAVAGLSRHA